MTSQKGKGAFLKKLTTHQLESIKDTVADHLAELQDSIGAAGSKVTFIIRHPSFPDSYLIVTDDELPALRDALNRAIEKPNMGEVSPPSKAIDMRML